MIFCFLFYRNSDITLNTKRYKVLVFFFLIKYDFYGFEFLWVQSKKLMIWTSKTIIIHIDLTCSIILNIIKLYTNTMKMAKFNILFKYLTVYIVFDIILNANTKCIRFSLSNYSLKLHLLKQKTNSSSHLSTKCISTDKILKYKIY